MKILAQIYEIETLSEHWVNSLLCRVDFM